MTGEEKKYIEECRKKFSTEQVGVIEKALHYGLDLESVRRFVMTRFSAEQMQEIATAMTEHIGKEAEEFLCIHNFTSVQIPEVAAGFTSGLTLEQVKTYASEEITANQMKKMRKQLLETAQVQKAVTGDQESLRLYAENLHQMMEESIRQFQASNEKFEVLSELVRGHVLEDKEQKIRHLKEALDQALKETAALRQLLGKKEDIIRSMNQKIPLQQRKKETEERQTEVGAGPKKPGIGSRLFARQKQEEKPRDLLDQIAGAELSPEQLEEVRQALNSGLSDQEAGRLVDKTLTAEKMQKMREIMLLVRERRNPNGRTCND